ncbi:hypothetical protein ACFV4P_09505, partial [Kitasatospora sp. NPDC059795]|uniref:hypothetical protein n=1 Tax=Kitasatospora sp. NPDC059795 TaxID=3346949 RepID=UPI00365962B9
MSNDVPWFAIDPDVEPAHTMRIPQGERIGVEAPMFTEAARVGWVEPDVMPAQRIQGGGPFSEAAQVGWAEPDVIPAQRIQGGGPFTEAVQVGRFAPDEMPAYRIGSVAGEPMETARLKAFEGVPLGDTVPAMSMETGRLKSSEGVPLGDTVPA